MTVFQRSVSGRLAAVLAGTALLVLGLGVPAYAATPTITSVSPNSGPMGCGIIIRGTNFKTPSVSSVTVNGASATVFRLDSDTQITAIVPSGATVGLGSMKVHNADGDSNSVAFTVTTTGCAPTITSFSPTSGAMGCGVTIIGTNFTGADVTGSGGDVMFGSTSAGSFTVVSPTQINAFVATGTSTGPVKVVTGAGSVTGGTFTVTSTCTPTISSFSPTGGPVGTGVTINGTNLLAATAVDFNGTPAVFTKVSSTRISTIVPVGATTGRIHVTAGAFGSGSSFGTAASSSDFTVGTGPAPRISSFTPTSGPVGTSVAITGTNFSGSGFTTTSVSFNNVNATTFTVNSSTRITATVPTSATTGPIRVTTPNGTATSSTDFTVTPVPAPTITSFTPTFGPVGTIVKITGTNFKGTGFTTTSVTFNNVTATFIVNTATMITATVPTGAITGPIKVTTPGGSSTSTTNFTVSTVHSRSLTLRLVKSLVARGVVSVGDGFTACVSSVPAKIQRRVSGHWETIATATTGFSGSYKKRIPDRPGEYRARATRVVLNAGADICKRATSAIRTR